MTLKSMTGFARSEGRDAEASWHWELRSVNGRGLDVRLRVPPGYEALEPRIRETISNHLVRGSVAVSLNVQRQSVVSAIRVNDAVLSQALAALERICASGDFERPRPDGLLALKGLVEIIERTETPEEAEARNTAMLASLATAIGDVIEARAAEGRRLQAVLAAQLSEIEDLTNRISVSPARSPEAIRARLKEQIGRLLDNTQGLDETRLYQEAALLAQRADIDEELKRLTAHVAAARELIAAAGPTGRRLDFIAQELNREANTLCAKSNDVEVTRLGLELKAVIDQLREQVQNIE